jgi:hypothetical protein
MPNSPPTSMRKTLSHQDSPHQSGLNLVPSGDVED